MQQTALVLKKQRRARDIFLEELEDLEESEIKGRKVQSTFLGPKQN